MSMNLNRLTPDAVHCIDVAVTTARERHNPFLDTEHLLVGALQTDLVKKALLAAGLSADSLLQSILTELSMIREQPLEKLKGMTRQAGQALNRAMAEAESLKVNYLNSGHIALSILTTPEPFLAGVLKQFPQPDFDQFRDTVAANSTPPSETFVQRWRPATWENAPLLMGGEGGTKTAGQQPVSVRFTTTSRMKQQQRQGTGASNMTPIWIALALLAAVVYVAFIRPDVLVPVTVVLGGWIVSLVLHEFAHALVAYWGGDYTVVDKGYLTLNPLKYMHPLLSIGLPLFFLAMGGIGLPGGAVYIERHRLKNRWWGSAVSAAGPFANLICLIVFSIPFWTGYVNAETYFEHQVFWDSLGFLVWLQAIAILFNLIPIPPLDGFGIIEPFLPDQLAFQLRSLGSIGLMLIILMFWMPSGNSRFDLGNEFIKQADEIILQVDVAPILRYRGWQEFRFWDED